MGDRYELGELVPLTFEVFDEEGDLADATAVTLTIALPTGTTADATIDHDPDVPGVYLCDYAPPVAGRYVARFVATGVHAGAVEDVFDVLPSGLAGSLTTTDCFAYLGETSATDDEVADALQAEQAAQAARCRIDPYAPDLRQALLRRVARNIAARSVPIATFTSFDGGGTSSRVPSTDPEITRLEAPYRRRKVG